MAPKPKDRSKPYRAQGQRPGGRQQALSDLDPDRYPGAKDPSVEVAIYSGWRVKRRYTVPKSRLPQAMARHASNHVKAKATEVISGDVVGESFTVSGGWNRPSRWVSYPG